MARIRYVGPHSDGVNVPDADLYDVKPGDIVDVSDAIAHGTPHELDADGDIETFGRSGLLESGQWELADSDPKTPDAAPAEGE